MFSFGGAQRLAWSWFWSRNQRTAVQRGTLQQGDLRCTISWGVSAVWAGVYQNGDFCYWTETRLGEGGKCREIVTSCLRTEPGPASPSLVRKRRGWVSLADPESVFLSPGHLSKRSIFFLRPMFWSLPALPVAPRGAAKFSRTNAVRVAWSKRRSPSTPSAADPFQHQLFSQI